jgi:hypothetical protein
LSWICGTYALSLQAVIQVNDWNVHRPCPVAGVECAATPPPVITGHNPARMAEHEVVAHKQTAFVIPLAQQYAEIRLPQDGMVALAVTPAPLPALVAEWYDGCERDVVEIPFYLQHTFCGHKVEAQRHAAQIIGDTLSVPFPYKLRQCGFYVCCSAIGK